NRHGTSISSLLRRVGSVSLNEINSFYAPIWDESGSFVLSRSLAGANRRNRARAPALMLSVEPVDLVEDHDFEFAVPGWKPVGFGHLEGCRADLLDVFAAEGDEVIGAALVH